MRSLNRSHRVLIGLLAISCVLGILSAWLHWRPGGWSTSAGGFPLLLVSAVGGLAAALLALRLRLALWLSVVFFAIQSLSLHSAGSDWSFQAGFTMEIPIGIGESTVIVNLIAVLATAWSLVLWHLSGHGEGQ